MLRLILLLVLLLDPPAPPDFDGDGDVDQSDWAIMQVHLGQPAMPIDRFDLNGDGMIDTKDADIFNKTPRCPRK